MKKAIIAIIAVVVAIAAITGGYFLFADKDEPKEELVAYRDAFVEGLNLIESFSVHPDRYTNSLINGYQMSEDVVASFFETPENWLAYEQLLEIQNVGENNLTIYGFEVKNNGKDGVYVSTSLGAEIGISAGASEPASISFSVLCSNGELSSEEVKAIVDKMDISIVYSKTPTEFDNGTESIEEKKTVTIATRKD